MIVIDASALVAVLLPHGPITTATRDRLRLDPHWIAPDHLTVEVLSAIRGHRLGGRITEAAALDALLALGTMDIDQRPAAPLVSRIWELKDNLSSYDAAYVALAEAEGCTLVTADARIAAAPGTRCPIEVISA
ncbi:type II toxin-antitoxin system VapC family toxin [Actinomyces capricornis]|uniref:Ribonuclease VapC n=1 Tax=Actinomyces capricornis TaxID=2755559 RepID=A0ABN6K1A3_9ACTO|nr:type II toxin-antitoxin system VapC family toxin [Actinomyces capricornis]BDA63374.1 VapC ribonuclease [Actinomyces capricornis]